MKKLKQTLLALFALNFAFLGLAPAGVSEVYADEEQTDEEKYQDQKNHLSKAINDYTKVISSDAYNLFLDDSIKVEYDKAIDEGNRVLEKGELASYGEMRSATIKIDNIKGKMKADVRNKIRQALILEQAVNESKLTINAVRLLIDTAPQKIAGVRDRLDKLVSESEYLIQQAEPYVQKVQKVRELQADL